MNKYNSVFLLVTLSAAIISFNTRAAEHGMITLNQNSGNLQPISPLVLLAAENGVLPSFEVQHLANSYNRYGNKVKNRVYHELGTINKLLYLHNQ